MTNFFVPVVCVVYTISLLAVMVRMYSPKYEESKLLELGSIPSVLVFALLVGFAKFVKKSLKK